MSKAPFPVRYQNPLNITLRAFTERGLLFSLAFGVLGTALLIGGLSMYLIEARINPNINTYIDGI